MTNRTVKNESGEVISSENYTYDSASNITDAPNSCFVYDTNNRLITFNGKDVSYDLDGNMLNNGVENFTYDSANRLINETQGDGSVVLTANEPQNNKP